ncbi:hypothetical protein [Treponema pedis]|uniref:hypothetical protein n=1 Tax=Treponema pedis TaxID=409322 RepID=UPI0004217485|nr:hypothetical protein [Treponema pedis]
MKENLINLKKHFTRSLTAVFLCFFFLNLYPETADTLTDLRSDFVLANIEDKVQILKNAELSGSNLIPLYKDCVKYVENSYAILGDDTRLLTIGIIGVTKLGELGEKSSAQDIRYLFSTVENEDFKIACLKSLSVLLEKDSGFTVYLNSLYENSLSDLLAGKKLNINLLIAYAQALGNFADTSSFEVLFKTLLYPVNETLKKAVKTALNNISFDYFYEIAYKKAEKNVQYIWTLYLLAKENKKIPGGQLGEISETVLSYGIENLETERELAEKLIEETLPVLADLKWSKASSGVNKFFYFKQAALKQAGISYESLIPVIDCMGNLGTAESSQNLSIFLGVLNSETEKTKQYDEKLMLSVITALGRLGDKTAFDYLLYVEYLNYSETVKQASRNAIEELKW